MYILKDIIIKSTVSLIVGIASAVGTQVGLTLWNRYIKDNVEETNKQSIKVKREFA